MERLFVKSYALFGFISLAAIGVGTFLLKVLDLVKQGDGSINTGQFRPLYLVSITGVISILSLVIIAFVGGVTFYESFAQFNISQRRRNLMSIAFFALIILTQIAMVMILRYFIPGPREFLLF